MLMPLLIIVLSWGLYNYFQQLDRAPVPVHLTHFAADVQENLIPKKIADNLLALVKELAVYPSNMDQSKAQGFNPTYEHIGEASPLPASGICPDIMFPNSDKTLCIFPQRIDVGKHYIMTGGLDGKKELVSDAIDRLSSFARYTFLQNISHSDPSVQELFHDDRFQTAAKNICPPHQNYLDPFAFNIILQVPGQTVAAHLDAPYFWGASRFNFPQWLLVAMVFSNLFQEKFIHQLQVVAYLHDWEVQKDDGGEFVYYDPQGAFHAVSPQYLSGTFVDGSKVLHAAKVYRPDVKAPHLPKDEDCALQYAGEDMWSVLCNDRAIASYPTSALRIATVYRARCFESAEQAKEYRDFQSNPANIMKLDEVLEKFKADLVQSKGLSAVEVQGMDRRRLGEAILQHYIKYPLPPKELAFIPYNYCAVPLMLPWTKFIFDFICK